MTGVESLPLPRMLAREAARDGWKAWVSELPEVVRTLEERWSLRVGEPFEPGGALPGWPRRPARARAGAAISS
jgi:streptomycin 6-kinase